MQLYRINPRNSKSNTIYVIADNCTIKDGTLTYFKQGEGCKTTKRFKLIDADIEPRKDALYIGKVAHEYGNGVAAQLCEDAFGCSNMSAENWTVLFEYAYTQAVEHGINPSDVALEVANNIRTFFGSINLPFLEAKLAEYDCEFRPSRCEWGDRTNVSTKQYIAEKYGKTSADFIQMLI